MAEPDLQEYERIHASTIRSLSQIEGRLNQQQERLAELVETVLSRQGLNDRMSAVEHALSELHKQQASISTQRDRTVERVLGLLFTVIGGVAIWFFTAQPWQPPEPSDPPPQQPGEF